MNLLVPLDPGVGCVLSGVLAVLFAHAAWHKWRSLALFRAQLEAYRLLPGALLGVAAVVIPLGETLIALGLLLGLLLGVGEQQVLAQVAPEEVLDEAHCVGLGPDEGLGVLDHLAVGFGNALEILDVRHGDP